MSSSSPMGTNIGNFTSPDTRGWGDDLKTARRAGIKSHNATHAGYFNKPFDKYNDLNLDEILPQEDAKDLAEYLAKKIGKSMTLRQLYGPYKPPVLPPSEFEILKKNGKPYILGRGGFASVILARNIITQDLVAIKLTNKIRKDEERHEDCMLKEVGLFLKGQEALNDGKPVALHGFLKIKDNSPLAKYSHKLMPVLGVASLTPNDPVCISVRQAVDMMREDSVKLFTTQTWAQILMQILEGTNSMYESGVRHADLNSTNILLTVVGDEVKVSFIDFGLSKEVDEFDACPHRDLFDLAREPIREIAECMDFEHTRRYADSIIRHEKFCEKLDGINNKVESYIGMTFKIAIAKFKRTIQQDLERFK